MSEKLNDKIIAAEAQSEIEISVPIDFIKDEIKAARREGAERMLTILKCKKPFVDNGTFTTICDHCMESMKIWEAFEKEDSK
jgi:hypothetical protein